MNISHIEEIESNKPVTVVIVGAGHRSLLYASYAEKHPDQLQIVGVVEPNPIRRKLTAEQFDLDDNCCFETVEQLAKAPKIADAVINGTMDDLHVETTIPLLQVGYDVLLEKPIATSEENMLKLYQTAREYKRTVMVCHVLRYAPFYKAIREVVASGDIGDIVNIQTTEHVSYHHMAVSFIRGKWNSEEKCKSSMLMAKCCHDLDIVTWMVGNQPKKVSSFGSLMQFKPENAPLGAGKRCMVDCQIEENCAYSARKHYIEQGRWGFYVWDNSHLGMEQNTNQKIEALRSDSPYGRCVWHCDNDVVDHQSVIIEFNNGCTATHNMVGATSRPCRTIHIVGTKGEITGILEDGSFVIRHPDPRKGHEYSEKRITVDVTDDSHGGGDLLLVADFVRIMRGEEPSLSSTSLEKSIYGHQIGFAAERSRLEGRTMGIDEIN
ncbi:Oxidoreductase family, C-terminal alpha/beta domain [Paenibacillus sp. 1_12]|uniref:Gfo/Idh/MocA family protein n=1 Tax=Paenibacillus sp. 1_12 TaxID=1566278 RepID=UPI0008F0EB96|nr:Gfo/Idh/MocA family oxidoreductase [Paenibacillus sp. 1_12]SFL77179.1 Oxidoreductase family, C-terminal alpha/beta domain [Paenibacillus sp. 1_12]